MSLPTVSATNVSVVNLETNEVYYTKGSGTVITASMAKAMTSRILLQNKTGSELGTETVTIVSGDIVGGTALEFVAGDVIILRSLFTAMIVHSCNTSATAISRHIGQDFLDVESGGVGDPIARFVTEMNDECDVLGMSSTTYVDASGVSTSNISNPADQVLLFASLRDETEFRLACRHHQIPILFTRSSAPSGYFAECANPAVGLPGVVLAKAGGLGGVYTNTLLWEAPNGQLVAVSTMGGSTLASIGTDASAILAQLPIDFTPLATSGTPFTPAYLFDTLGYGGGWWDGTDNASMKQTSGGSTDVTATSDPVGKWSPKAGTSGPYFRQATSGSRPVWNSAGYVTFDGTDDFLDLGDTTIGGTALFAEASDPFCVGVKFRMNADVGTLIAKCEGGDRQFQLLVAASGSIDPGVYTRGNAQTQVNGVSTGGPHSATFWWDGTNGGVGSNNKPSTQNNSIGPGAAQTSQNIILGARTQGSAGFLNGRIYQAVIVDTYDADAFRRTRDWLNGASVNAFEDPTGGLQPVRRKLQLQQAVMRASVH